MFDQGDKMRKVLIFGGSVFIGKAVAESYVQNGDEVYVLNRGNHPIPDGVKHIEADRNNSGQLSLALSNMEFDIVFDGSSYRPDQTCIAVDVLKGYTGHFIHLSSASVYSDEIMPYTEKALRGTSKSWGEYSTNKYNCEEILFSEWKESKFPITILRPFYVYGPGNNLDRESYIFSRLLSNRTIVVPAMGEPVIPFGHIDDLCKGIMMVSQNNKCFGEAYNVSGNEHISFKEWIEVCAKVVDVKPKLFLTNTVSTCYKARDWFPFRDVSMFGSCEKIENDTGFKPQYSIFEGLKQTIEKVGIEYFAGCLKISEAEKDILENSKIY